MPRPLYPDSVEANAQGCSCPIANNKGAGKTVDGVTEWVIGYACPLHTSQRWWTRSPKPSSI